MSAATFKAALARAKRRRQPVIALRPDHTFIDELDDVVVCNVQTFRAEAMDTDMWWMECTFANGEALTFHVTIGRKPKRLVVTATSVPAHLDWDDLFNEHRGATA
jgi:hypothetical protein